MTAHLHRPSSKLGRYVDCLWLWDGYEPPSPRERALPSGTLDLVINLADDRITFYRNDSPESKLELPGITLSGAHAGPFVIGTSRRTSVMGVHFVPGGAFPFFDFPLSELEGQHVPLESLWGRAARELRERLQASDNARARLDLLESFLEQRARALRLEPVLDTALAAFEDPSLESVAEVNRRMDLSPKRLIALFRQRVGMTPKAFWRVRRFQAVLRSIERRERKGAELALLHGYFDQAHLDREFRFFTGLSPRAYLAAEIERPNHVPLRG